MRLPPDPVETLDADLARLEGGAAVDAMAPAGSERRADLLLAQRLRAAFRPELGDEAQARMWALVQQRRPAPRISLARLRRRNVVFALGLAALAMLAAARGVALRPAAPEVAARLAPDGPPDPAGLAFARAGQAVERFAAQSESLLERGLPRQSELAQMMGALRERGGEVIASMVPLSGDHRRRLAPRALAALKRHAQDLRVLRGRMPARDRPLVDAQLEELERRVNALWALVDARAPGPAPRGAGLPERTPAAGRQRSTV